MEENSHMSFILASGSQCARCKAVARIASGVDSLEAGTGMQMTGAHVLPDDLRDLGASSIQCLRYGYWQK